MKKSVILLIALLSQFFAVIGQELPVTWQFKAVAISDEETELRSLKKICMLEGDYEVYPGHGDSSTLQIERMFNYYCREAVKNY